MNKKIKELNERLKLKKFKKFSNMEKKIYLLYYEIQDYNNYRKRNKSKNEIIISLCITIIFLLLSILIFYYNSLKNR